jgi:NAD-dependent DNA ligase
MTDLTPVLQALAGLISAIITAMVIPYIKSKADIQTLERIQRWTRIAADAAEQLHRAPGCGGAKKAYVRGFLQERGFNADASTLNALIESCVHNMNKGAHE